MRRSIVSLLAALSLLLSLSSVHAQGEVPAYIPVQGYLTDTKGVPVEGATDVILSLYTEAEDNGAPAFHTESQTVNVAAGNFFTYLGDKQPLDVAAFKDKAKGIVFLGVTVDSGPELSPRLQLGLAPFAAFSQSCGDSQTLAGHDSEHFATAAHTHTAEELGIKVDADETVTQAPPPMYSAGTGIDISGTTISAKFDGTGTAPTAAHSDHKHAAGDITPPKAVYYNADSSTGSAGQAIVTTTSAHALCALTRVRYDNPSTTTKSRYCAVENLSDGKWRLLAGGFDGTKATCTMACIF